MKCEFEGCQNEGFECRQWDYRETPPRLAIEHLCSEHARKAGYCWMCGEFWAGAENLSPSGLCSNCRDDCEPEEVGELAGMFAEGV